MSPSPYDDDARTPVARTGPGLPLADDLRLGRLQPANRHGSCMGYLDVDVKNHPDRRAVLMVTPVRTSKNFVVSQERGFSPVYVDSNFLCL